MINERLKEVRQQKGVSQSSFAALFGLKQQTYQKYESGIASIPDELKQQLSQRFNVNLHWLITGHGEMYVGGNAEESACSGNSNDGAVSRQPMALKDSVEVPMLDLKLSAGMGDEWGLGSPTGESIYVPKRVARRYPSNSVFVGALVDGDSMEPTLHDGEPVVFVKGFVKGDGIYVLAVNGELFVKRLEFNRILNRLRIISDNPKYPPTELGMDALDGVRILGKVVIWVHGEV